MTAVFDETALRHWLVDYLVTNIGCSPGDIDFEASLNDLGVGSRDAVVLAGELAELLGRPVSPVEFWAHPTIGDLAAFLAGGNGESTAGPGGSPSVDHRDEPIAIIGLGCRFPGDLSGPDAFWDFLRDGATAVGEVPAGRWDDFTDGSPEEVAALSNTTRWGAFLTGIDQFDAEYFEVSPSEAAAMDPQQRLLLEVVHEALEHAGIPANAVRHSQTGVFAGACLGEYGYLASRNLSQVGAWSGTGGALSIIANRLSYHYDLRGPSVTVDTACSSSLVAVHLACQSLRAGESQLAIAAGVNVILSPAVTRSFDQAQAMSPTGTCHAFDAAADGFVRGEGCGVVLLKRLGDALRDGDKVLAVVRGSAVNQDGRSNGLMAPNPAAQMAVLRSAYANAGLQPHDVDYVEAHGTGTLLGDPIEARALGSVLGRGRAQDAPLLIGSVKSNLGHLEAAAGVAGLIKTVLALQHGQIPATLHFREPNPHIPFANLRLDVVAEHTPWPDSDTPRRAGVSSFGFGGTNAHLVVEQAPESQPPVTADRTGPAVTTLVVSGKSDERIAATADTLADLLTGSDHPLAEVAHTLNHHRDRHGRFATVAACDRAQAIAGLRALAAGQSAPGVVAAHRGMCRAGTVFVYSGQGSQWVGMGRTLLADEPAFARAVDALEPAFIEHAGFSLRDVLADGLEVTGIAKIQPVLVGVQLALTELWRSYGVQPDAVIGHSMGEVTAAVVAGSLTPADGLRVIATRSQLMSRLSGRGAMALVELSADAAKALAATQPDVSVAVYASPGQSVIAGPAEQVDALIDIVDAQGRLARRVDVDVASHHRTIDPVLPELRTALADLSPKPPTIPVFSTTLGTEGGLVPRFDADYWCDNLRHPVQFAGAVTAAGAEHGTFIEVSPHPLLTYAISETLADVHHHAVPTLHRDGTDTLSFHTNLNSTHTAAPPETEHPAEPHIAIPTTPWRHRSHWMAPVKRVAAGLTPAPGTLLGEPTALSTASMRLWQARLVPEVKPYKGFHRLQGVEVVPLSVLVQTMAAAAAELGDHGLTGLRLEQPVVVDQPGLVQVIADGDSLTLASSAAATPDRWVRHVSAQRAPGRPASEPLPTVAHTAATDPERRAVEQMVDSWGVEGKPYDWDIETLAFAPGAVTGQVRLGEPTLVGLVDAAVHLGRLADRGNLGLMVPSAIESLWLAEGFSDTRGDVVARRRGEASGDLVVDITARGADGTVVAELRGVTFADIEAAPTRRHTADPAAIAHTIDWQPWTTHTDRAIDPGGLVVLGGPPAERARLRDRYSRLGCPPATVDTARYVIHLGGTGGETGGDAAARLCAEIGDVVRRLATRPADQPATLWLVTRGLQDPADEAALGDSCLWGLAGVIATEQPHVWGGLLDIAAGADLARDAAALSVLTRPSGEVTVARRGEQFLVPVLAPLTAPADRPALRCRPAATYLITGGLGALGLLMADWLADRGARRLLLAGRTALPPRREWHRAGDRRVAAITALEERGVSVDLAAVDVGDAEALHDLIERRDRDGAPPVRGVIHAAGITENELVTDLSEAALRRVMWPKVAGARALHEVFPPGTLEFLFLTASAGSVFGVPGQGAYAAANAYLDGLARARHRRGCHTMSLDWVAWEGLGFAADAALVADELERRGSRPVTPEEAFRAWEYADRHDVAQVVMAPTDTTAEAEPAAGPDPAAHDWSAMTSEERIDLLHNGLRAILARELQLPDEDLRADRPFAELGLNSLAAMSIRREAESLVGLQLSATMLWNHPTIAELSTYLATLVVPQHESASVEEASPAAKPSLLDGLLDSAESTHA